MNPVAVLAMVRQLGGTLPDTRVVGCEPPGMVLMHTAFGGSRVVDVLIGDPLPRIC